MLSMRITFDPRNIQTRVKRFPPGLRAGIRR
jgi:hypothetical protein